MPLAKILATGEATRWVRGAVDVETNGWACHDITLDINAFLREAFVKDGVLVAASAHTTASLIVQENADPDVQADLVAHLSRLAPPDAPYVHGEEGPDDMPGHIKAAITGHTATLLVADGSLLLGQWQSVYLVEHRHAPRTRTIWMHFTGS